MISEAHVQMAIALTFGSLGLFHFVFGKTMQKYAVENGLLNANIAVKMSGALLIVSSVALYIEDYAHFGYYGICLFLVLSSLILHQFWSKKLAVDQLLEMLHFAKNLLLALLVWYLGELLT